MYSSITGRISSHPFSFHCECTKGFFLKDDNKTCSGKQNHSLNLLQPNHFYTDTKRGRSECPYQRGRDYTNSGLAGTMLGTHHAQGYPGFCSMKRLEIFLLPLDRMLVHRRVTQSIKFPSTLLYTRMERGTVRELSVLPKNTTQSPRPGLEPCYVSSPKSRGVRLYCFLVYCFYS